MEASVIFKIKIIFTCVQNMGEKWDIRQLQRSLRKRKQNFSLRGYTLQEEIRTRSDFNQLDYAQIGPSMAHFSNLSLSNQVAAANMNLKILQHWAQICCQDSIHNSEEVPTLFPCKFNEFGYLVLNDIGTYQIPNSKRAMALQTSEDVSDMVEEEA